MVEICFTNTSVSSAIEHSVLQSFSSGYFSRGTSPHRLRLVADQPRDRLHCMYCYCYTTYVTLEWKSFLDISRYGIH